MTPTAGLCLLPVPWVKKYVISSFTYATNEEYKKAFVGRHTLAMLSYWFYSTRRTKQAVPYGICEVGSLEKFAQVLFFCSLGKWA